MMKNFKLKYVFITFLILLAAFSILQAEKAQNFALVLKTEGDVIVKHGKNLFPAEKGTIVYDNDVILSKDKSSTVIQFSDNSITAKIFANSTVTLNLGEENNRPYKKLNMSTGKILSDVKPNKGIYEIVTPGGVASVRGTKFLTKINLNEDKTYVQVFEGSVEFGNDNGMITIPQGKECVAQASEVPRMKSFETKKASRNMNMDFNTSADITVPDTPQSSTSTTESPAPTKGDDNTNSVSDKTGGTKGLLPFPTSVGIGAVTLGDEMFTRIRLMPELKFWKFHLGLDFDILLDTEGKIREKDWDNFDDYLNKILYLQFAQRKDPFYFRLGGFTDLQFGHGLIMSNYTNMLNYPNVKQLGAEVAVNTKFYGLGFDLFSSNLDRNDILAGRITATPFTFTKIPLLKILVWALLL